MSASCVSAQSCQDESSVENGEAVVEENVKAKNAEEGDDALAPPAGFGDLDSPSKKARNNGQGEFNLNFLPTVQRHGLGKGWVVLLLWKHLATGFTLILS